MQHANAAGERGVPGYLTLVSPYREGARGGGHFDTLLVSAKSDEFNLIWGH